MSTSAITVPTVSGPGSAGWGMTAAAAGVAAAAALGSLGGLWWRRRRLDANGSGSSGTDTIEEPSDPGPSEKDEPSTAASTEVDPTTVSSTDEESTESSTADPDTDRSDLPENSEI